jgi:ABC-2 type transport system permease protein
MAYSTVNRRRSWPRKVLQTLSAYIRIDLVEERTFPLSTVLRYVAVVFPVLLYYFQSAFLGLGDQMFLIMLIGTGVSVGLQDALTGLTGRLTYAQERGTLETYLVEPVPWALIPVAMNVWRSFTGTVCSCLMIGWGVVLGAPIKLSAIPLAFVVLLLGVTACNAIGTLASSYLVLFKRGDPVIMLYGLAASVLGGALFPITVLPGWLRWMSYLIPHSYVISAERQLLMENPPVGGPPPWLSVTVLVGFCTVVFGASLFIFDRSLKLARRLGILSV